MLCLTWDVCQNLNGVRMLGDQKNISFWCSMVLCQGFFYFISKLLHFHLEQKEGKGATYDVA
jgi:hypothetical protein